MFQVFYTPKSNSFYVINIDNSLVSGWSFDCIRAPLHTPSINLMRHISNNSVLTHLKAVNPNTTIVDLGNYESIDAVIDSNPHLLI